MHRFVKNILNLLLLAVFLTACLPASGGFQLPSLEVALREFSNVQPVTEVPPTIIASPSPVAPTPPVMSATPQPATGTPTITPLPYPLWIEASVPEGLRTAAQDWNLPASGSASLASLQLGLAEPSDSVLSTWVYALVAPFPTIMDGVSFAELEEAWSASSSGPVPESPLWMTESTLSALTTIFGEPGPGAVQTVSAEELVNTLWEQQPAWGIVPFEALEPKLKVLSIDKQSPIRKNFDPSVYPLKVNFSLTGEQASLFELPATNLDPSKMTVVLMTGVTALVRATATRMEIIGVDYPAWNIEDTLKSADITHISNEIPFYTGCPYPDPRQEGLVFCSNPKYIELLEMVGADVIELTGNHFQDYGSVATLQTLDMYDERGWPYFGGGRDLADSRKPALMTHNGNRFAFIGCNPVGPGFAWATETQPGAAACDDYQWMKDEIASLSEKGYNVFATFQYIEYYVPEPTEEHMRDFRAIADAGATIVSGSQAHVPQAMEFYGNTFIHYGLGNLFFDQMDGPSRREFLDWHVFYDGHYISTELITAMLEDYARPRPMRSDERLEILTKIFDASGWVVPTSTE